MNTVIGLVCLVASSIAAPLSTTRGPFPTHGPRPSQPTRPAHPTRPGGSSSCQGKCTDECPTGQACIFSFNPSSPDNECACGVPRGPHTRPVWTTMPKPTHGPHRTIPKGLQNCDAWDEKSTDVSNKDTCAAICKDHRHTFDSFVVATATTDAQCCCAGGRAGAKTCCAVPDVPEPSRQPGANSCSVIDQAQCVVPTGKIIASCLSKYNADCDIDDPNSCDALWECAQEAAGSDAMYEQCCGCFEQKLAFIYPDIDLPCEVGRQ